jgi:hypothetical protein
MCSIVSLLGLALASCGDDEGDATPAGTSDPAREAYEKASVPVPVPYAGSSLRVDAGRRGAFAGLPGVSPEALGDLLRLFAKAKADAAAHPGSGTAGAGGPTYEPTFDELRLAEIGQRIEETLARAKTEQARETWTSSGLAPDEALDYGSFQVITVKVFGTGFVQTVERVPKRIPAP